MGVEQLPVFPVWGEGIVSAGFGAAVNELNVEREKSKPALFANSAKGAAPVNATS
jgi:hypothetical protein